MRALIYIFMLLLMLTKSYGQISPGELTSAHASLEGISNCIKCHDLGDKVSNVKCLDCHKEIKSLLTQNRGYHSGATVKNKECIECHSEHHGRTFEMTRFDEKKFDHNLTKYKLEGKHAEVDCRKCHIPENIENADLKKRKNTFLGLDKKCLSCHDDYHQKTMSNDCSKCHNIVAFKPAKLFDHNKTDFVLKGKHIEVDCKLCHKMTIKNGKDFQVFADIPFNDCKNCHQDPHLDQLSSACSQCHNETAFTNFTGKQTFNHNTTNFTLKGKHKTTDCFKCHLKTGNPLEVFQDHLNVDENNCISCHKDVHAGKLGTDCAKCHNENSFVSLKTKEFFNHDDTDYPLRGKHIGIDCKKCHTGKTTDAIDFSLCSKCHKDYHEGEFTKDGVTPDCDKCHSLNEPFTVSLFTTEQHQTTKFPLEGAHLATPCLECHFIENKWKFKDVKTGCVDCHKHEHGVKYEKNGVTTCERCHDSKNWFPSKFNHDETRFRLEGKHAKVECTTCHIPYTENGKTKIKYVIEKFECTDCHQ